MQTVSLSALVLYISLGIVGVLALLLFKYIYLDCDWHTLHLNINKSYFCNKTIWITGCTSGIGRHLTYHLSSTKFKVSTIIISGRSLSYLRNIRDDIITNVNNNINIIIVSDFDLNNTDFNYYNNIYNDIINKLNKLNINCIDILINNVGVNMLSYANDVSIPNDLLIFNVNLISHIILLKLCLRDMIKYKNNNIDKHIVCISSADARLNLCCKTTLNSTKSALLSYYKSLRDEISEYNISISVILPANINTNINKKTIFKNTKNKCVNIKNEDIIDNDNDDDDTCFIDTISCSMNVNRCCELILKSISNKVIESWPCNQPYIFYMHLSYYFPYLYEWYKSYSLNSKIKKIAGYN